MNSSFPRERISNLPEAILVMIISCLPFKDCVRTSGVSKVWRHLYRETKNVAFRQSDFMSPDVYDQPKLYAKAMVAFADVMCRWVRINGHHPIYSFELSISDPEVFLNVNHIQELIAFAVQKKVKKLVLNFSHLDWEDYDNVVSHDLVVEVPESIYNLTTLESLTVAACKNFELSRFSNPENFKSLYFGWMSLKNLQPLLSRASKLDSLTIHGCWDLDFYKLEGNMREFTIHDSKLLLSYSFNLPNLEIFKYSGDILSFEFERMNAVIKEVHLGFSGFIDEYGEPLDPTDLEVITLCDSLNHLPSSKILTFSPYTLQVIHNSKHPHLLHQVKTQHLVIETQLHPKEFSGLWLILNSCPDLETLTFDLLYPRSIVMASSISWMKKVTLSYLRKTVKVVVVRNFSSSLDELNLVKNLIQSGREYETLLKKVEIYMSYYIIESEKMSAYEDAKMLQRYSNRVQVIVHNS